jgi:hypothetical protein
LCGVYYYVYIKVLPRLGNYQFRQSILTGPAGETSHQLVKVLNAEVAQWDDEHDAAGRMRRRRVVEKTGQPLEA